MAPTGTASQFDQAVFTRRQQLQGAAGPAALLKNARVFGIACFACLGGLLYGYNQASTIKSLRFVRSTDFGFQGVFSGVLTMYSFGERE